MTHDLPLPDSVGPVSGTQLLKRIGDGAMTPAEAFEQFAARYAALEGELRCFVEADFSTPAAFEGPIMGLPVGVKDIMDTADFATAHGSPIYAGHRTRGDASAVMLARQAGATIVGKTVTTEFAFFNPGPTRNPWNTAHTPGGSSSGSAAAVAAGILPFAFGTQTGGSMIRPASFCGIAGYKPSFGLIPIHGTKPFSLSLDTIGVFGATVPDCRFFAERVSGRELAGDDTAAPTIAVCHTHAWGQAGPEMQDALAVAARRAEDAGARVVECKLPGIFERAADAHRRIQNYEAARALAWEAHTYPEKLSPILRETLEEGRRIDATDYDAARSTAKGARLALMKVFDGIDVLLTPSSEDAAPEGLETTGRPTFNRLWTLMGVPCVNVPGLRNTAGMPLGIQVVGPAMADARTLAAAAWLETALNG